MDEDKISVILNAFNAKAWEKENLPPDVWLLHELADLAQHYFDEGAGSVIRNSAGFIEKIIPADIPKDGLSSNAH